jgi:hypothetical protein
MTGIQPAARELTALAYAMRGWDPEHTMAAMLAAKNAGWDFGRTFREVARLLLLEDGDPAALRHAAGSLLRPIDSKPADGPAAAAKAREQYPNLRRRDNPQDAA